MNKMFTDNGWEDYTYWQTEDKKTLKKINNLIKDISSSIESDAEELKKQLENKKENEELYKQAVLGIEEIKNNI